MTAFLITLPFILYQILEFHCAGLVCPLKNAGSWPLVVASMLLFLSGMASAYLAVFPMVFGFITASAPQGVAVMTDIDKYLSFVLSHVFAFGVTFQVPVAVVAMVKMGFVSVAKLREIRRYVIVGRIRRRCDPDPT